MSKWVESNLPRTITWKWDLQLRKEKKISLLLSYFGHAIFGDTYLVEGRVLSPSSRDLTRCRRFIAGHMEVLEVRDTGVFLRREY